MKMHSPYLKLLHIEFIAFTNLCLKRHIALGARYLGKEKHFFSQPATLLCCVQKIRLLWYHHHLVYQQMTFNAYCLTHKKPLATGTFGNIIFINDRYGAVNG